MAVSEDDLRAMLETPLFGHTAQEAQLAEAVFQKRLPSAYLFTGAQGIGKASMALRLSASLLAGKAVDDGESINLFGGALPSTAPATLQSDTKASALKRMVQRSHSDFLLLQPEYDGKKQAFKREIVIGQTRKIGDFLSRTAGEGVWKIIIIDPADAMNVNAANALLKWLEEPPPHSLFILVTHAVGKLLPTIRSRCRELAFASPPYDLFARVLGLDANDVSTRQLHRFTSGSLGLARTWQATQWSSHWQGLLSLILSPAAHQPALVIHLSDAIMKDAAFPLYNLQRLLDSLLLRVTRFQQTGVMEADIPDEARTIELLAARHALHYWLALWDEQRTIYMDVEKLYLDKRYAMISLFSQL